MEKQIKNQNSADALCINLLSDIYEYIDNDKRSMKHKPANVGSPCETSTRNKHIATYLASIFKLKLSTYTLLDVSSL